MCSSNLGKLNIYPVSLNQFGVMIRELYGYYVIVSHLCHAVLTFPTRIDNTALAE
jgi:hypothetical protein